MRKEFKYYLYDMCGNKTALVEEDVLNNNIKKIINDEIMSKNKDVEQVGFVSLKEYKLTMAGGEFCGNATRGSAYYYLNGNKGDISIKVANNIILKAGVDEKGFAWTEMPLCNNKKIVKKLDEGIYEVILQGINFIILDEEKSKDYLKDKESLKEKSKMIIRKYNINDSEATGVIFKEKDGNRIRINPVVWVKSIDTVFYENACGSGTTAVAILETLKNKESQDIDIIQPSNEIITAKINYDKGKNVINNAIIYGDLRIQKDIKKIIINV